MTTPTRKLKKNVHPRLVADDNGYADHKLAWFDSAGKILTGKVPALIQVGGQGLTTADGTRIGAYRVDEVEYTCSSAIDTPMNLRNADYPVSIPNRVLFNHALARFGLLGMPIKAAVSLPFRDYFSGDGQMNEELKAASAANFMQANVQVLGSPAQPEVQDVVVYAEALSAWFDWALEDDGSTSSGYEELVDLQGEMLVADIGGSTTDLASFKMTNEVAEGQMIIGHKKSGTEKVGVLDAKAKLEELVRKTMTENGVKGFSGHSSQIPNNLLETIMQKGKAHFAGKVWDFTVERELATRSVAEQITSYIKSTVGNVSAYYAILVVGGGAVVFRDALSKLLPSAIFMDEFANARGMLKFMRGQNSQE